MKAILQRATSASVTISNTLHSSIGRGILVYLAVAHSDTPHEAEVVAKKVLALRLWEGEDGAAWKRSVKDIGGEVLCVSQFTLLATLSKGTKPSFHRSAPPAHAKQIYDHFVATVRKLYLEERVKEGVFQAMMAVACINDGPVTLEFEVEAKPVAVEEGKVVGNGAVEGAVQREDIEI